MSELDFVREAFPEDEREFTELLEGLDALAPRARTATGNSADATERLWASLARSTAEWPTRYAPFYEELADLFGYDETSLVRELERARAPGSWSRTPFRGVRFFQLERGPRRARGECLIAHFEAGARLPRHRHPGAERSLVLEGGYRDENGELHHAGDLHESEAGSAHELVVLPGGPCVTALHLEERFVFDSFFARALLAWFWKKR